MEKRKESCQMDWDSVVQLMNSASNILLVCHVHPDADAIGSLISLGLSLISQGKKTYLVVDGGVTEEMKFLSGSELIQSKISNDLSPDLVVALDSDDWSVLGESGQRILQFSVPVLVIDHHAYNELYGKYHLVSSTFVSTTEIIYHLLKRLGWEISQKVAEAILAGVMSDTQLFRTENVSGTTFSLVHELLQIGARYNFLLRNSYLKIPSGHLQLLGYALSKAKLQNNVIWTQLYPTDFWSHGLNETTPFYVVDELIKDSKACIAAFFRIIDDQKIRVSMRANPGFDVGKIADQLGGGGHVLSAGCMLVSNNFEETIQQVVQLLIKEVQKNDSPD